MESFHSDSPRRDAPVRTAVLVSGGGSNLQALIDRSQAGDMPHVQLTLVASNRRQAFALERARQADLPVAYVGLTLAERHELAQRMALSGDLSALQSQHPSFREAIQKAQEDKLEKALQAHDIELIVLAGFLLILSPAFVARWAGRMLNIHPSLLPAFGGAGFYGLKVHEAVLASGAKRSGASVHLVTPTPDAGPVLYQRSLEVQADDTAESLQKRILEEIEHQLLPQAVEEIAGAMQAGRWPYAKTETAYAKQVGDNPQKKFVNRESEAAVSHDDDGLDEAKGAKEEKG